jgi:ribulose-5-phosphate 4-epimerase/fuculose-1-phosphate aldolase
MSGVIVVPSEIPRDDSFESVELRRKLAAAFRIIAHRQMDDGIAGHISVRVPGAPGEFWVNPLGMLFEEITADDLLRVNHQGQILSGRHRYYNRAGFCIHSAIHQKRPDVNAICHTHPPKGTAFSALGIPMKILDQTACAFHRDQAVFTKYTGVVTEPELAEELSDALGEMRVAILQNHGILTCASTIEQAVVDMLDMERTCELNLLAMKAGEIREIPDEVAEATKSTFVSPGRIRLEWQARVRQIERIDPHYAGSRHRASLDGPPSSSRHRS